MGLIRSGAVIFFSGLLFLSIFLGNIFLTVSWSLEYETVQTPLIELTKNLIGDLEIERIITKDYGMMQLYCETQNIYDLIEGDINLNIPCSIITQGPQQTIEYGAQETIKQLYYKNYQCEFWECVKNTDTLFVLISDTAREYWHNKFYLAIISSIILFALLFLFIESKKSALTITGALIIVASIPFRKINWILSLLPEGNFTDLFAIFFTRAHNVFLTTIIIGITIFLIGLAFEFFKIGIKITNFFRWIFKRDDSQKEKNILEETEQTFTKEEVKEIIKKEIKKQKIKNDVKKIVKEELKENN